MSVHTEDSYWSLWEPKVAPAKKYVKALVKGKKENKNYKVSSGHLNEIKRQVKAMLENRKISARIRNSKPVICFDTLNKQFEQHKMVSKSLSGSSSLCQSQTNIHQSLGAYHQLNLTKIIKKQRTESQSLINSDKILTTGGSCPSTTTISPKNVLYKSAKEQSAEAMR